MSTELIRLAHFVNIPSHYQVALGRAFANLLKDEYVQVCMEPTDDEHRRLGWPEKYGDRWLLEAWSSDSNRAKATDILQSADVVIWGTAPVAEINKRVASGKLTFRYSERPFKRGRWRLLDPRVLKGLLATYIQNNCGCHHLLAVGPYCAADFRWMHLFRNRKWRWGYFAEMPTPRYRRRECRPPVILWAGRMIAWKRVDVLLRAAAHLRVNGAEFELWLIGGGPEEPGIRALAKQLDLQTVCKFLGPQIPNDVAAAMENADIYVLPSNQQEGWGVVVNEAMARGCCVIASQKAGAAPWLIQDGVNGRIFREQTPEGLARVLDSCLSQSKRMQAMGLAAQNTIQTLWAPQIAANRFLELCEAINSGRPSPFADEGPCSAAS